MKSISLMVVLAFQVLAFAYVPKITRDGDTFYLVRADETKIQLVQASPCGRANKFFFIPEINKLFFTKCNALAFESYGSDIFCCDGDGADKTFLRKECGDLDTAIHLNYLGRNFIIMQFSVSESEPYIQVYESETGLFFARMSGYALKRLAVRPCIQTKYPDRIICGDSLIRLSQNSIVPVELVLDYISSNIYSTDVEKPILGFTNEKSLVIYQSDSNHLPERFQCNRITFDSSIIAGGCCLTVTASSTFGDYQALSGSAASYSPAFFLAWLLIYNTRVRDIAYLECFDQSYRGQVIWSPTGKRVAYVRNPLNENSEIVILQVSKEPYLEVKTLTEVEGPCTVESLKWKDDSKLSFEYKRTGNNAETRYIDLTED